MQYMYMYHLIPLLHEPSPPPDPHPRIISPATSIPDEDVEFLFSVYTEALGFYLLVNGHLQVIVPDDFDYQTARALSRLPLEFGGLKVSFLLGSGVIPTARESESECSRSGSSTATTCTSIPPSFQSQTSASGAKPASPTASSSTGMPQSSITNLFKETYGSTLRATITTNTPMTNAKRSITNKTKERQPRFEGKIGVIVSPLLDLPDTASGPDNNNVRYYATASTHVFTSAVIHASSKTGGPASLLLQNKSWVSSVSAEIIGPGGASCESSLKLGEIRHVFDEKPEMFPVGFSHDVSLVEVPEHVLLGLPLGRVSSGDGEKGKGGSGSGSGDWTMTWLDQNEWMNIKYNTTGGLALMDGGSGGKEAKSIGVVDSRCQVSTSNDHESRRVFEPRFELTLCFCFRWSAKASSGFNSNISPNQAGVTLSSLRLHQQHPTHATNSAHGPVW